MPLAKISSARSRISSLVTVLLITRRRRSEPVSGAMVIDPLAALPQQLDDRLGQIVEAQRRRADRVAHLEQAAQDALDLGMIAQRDRHQAGPAGVRPRRARELEDAIGGKRADRQVVVAGPAEAAQVRAAAHDFDQEARAELGVGREDARRRRIEPRRCVFTAAFCTTGGAPVPGFGVERRRSCRRPHSARRRTTGCRSRARRRAGAAGRRDRSPRRTRRRSAGTSTSPSPAAITSANGASGSGFTNVTAPPITTSGSRVGRASARGRKPGQPQQRQHVRVVPLERHREREDVEVARPASATRASRAASPDASCAASSCFGGRNTRSQTMSSRSLKSR